MNAVPSSLEREALAEAAAPAPDAEFFIVMNQGSGASEKDEVRRIIEAELQAAGRAHQFIPIRPGEIVQACQ
jgi:hypothetical protein